MTIPELIWHQNLSSPKSRGWVSLRGPVGYPKVYHRKLVPARASRQSQFTWSSISTGKLRDPDWGLKLVRGKDTRQYYCKAGSEIAQGTGMTGIGTHTGPTGHKGSRASENDETGCNQPPEGRDPQDKFWCQISSVIREDRQAPKIRL